MGHHGGARAVLAHPLLEARQPRRLRVPNRIEADHGALEDVEEGLGDPGVDGGGVRKGVTDSADTSLRERQHECTSFLAPVVAACRKELARGAQPALGVAPEEGVLVGRWGDAVSPEDELVVEANAEREDVSFGDDDAVCVGLWRRRQIYMYNSVESNAELDVPRGAP